MILSEQQFVNIHAHRPAGGSQEWVLRSIRVSDYPPDPDPDSFYSVGIHPWDAAKTDAEEALKMVQLSTENCQVLAIGEIGIDASIQADMEFQLKLFRAQVEIAEFAGLPVIIHAVKANEELIAFSKSAQPGVPMIIHGFNGSVQLAEDLVKFGYYISFGAALLTSEKTAHAFSVLPTERIFLETDESDTPISAIYKRAAELKGMEAEALAGQIARKTQNMFDRSSD